MRQEAFKSATNDFFKPVTVVSRIIVSDLFCMQGHEGGQEFPGPGKEIELCSGQ